MNVMNFGGGGGEFGRNRTPGFWNGDFVHRNCSIRSRNSVDKEETPEISVNIQDDSDDGDSRSAPSVSSNTSCSESGAKSSRKRAQKSTKTFVDNKRKKLQKKLTQEGTQDILLQHLQRQLKLQQPLSYYANQRFVTFHDFYMMST